MAKPNHLNIILRPAQHVIHSHHAYHQVERTSNGDVHLGANTQNIIIFTVFSPLIFFAFLLVCALVIYLFAQRHLSLDQQKCHNCPESDASPLLTEQQFYYNRLNSCDSNKELLTEDMTLKSTSVTKGKNSTEQPPTNCRTNGVVVNMNGTSLKSKDKFHREGFPMEPKNKKSNYVSMV